MVLKDTMNIRFILQRVMLAAIMIASIYFGIQNLRDAIAIGNLNSDPVTDWEVRFQQVKKNLPFKRGAIGFLQNSDVLGTDFDNNLQGEYTLTQYAMSPIILMRGDKQEWTLAELNSSAFQVWDQANHGKFRVYVLNDNLYLFQRLTP
jgi:hypothetical protein